MAHSEHTESTGPAELGRSTETGAAQPTSSPTSSGGGWRAQPVALKVLLFVSLVFIALGVYRCSVELVPAADTSSIRVERATIAVPDSLLPVPADSLASLATRLFARGLREAHSGDVTVGEDPSAWAVARLHIRSVSDGRVELVGTAASALSGRRLSAVSVSDSPDRLREMAEAAALDMAEQLASTTDSEPEAR